MIAAVFVFLILLVAAWACAQFIPYPFGLVLALIVGILAVYVLVEAVTGSYVVT